jgi:hypothetical protein
MNVIRVVVQSKNLTEVKDFKGKNYGWQGAAMYNGGDFPAPFRVNVQQGHEYEPGEYTFAPQSFVATEQGHAQLKRVKLLPLGGSSAPMRK